MSRELCEECGERFENPRECRANRRYCSDLCRCRGRYRQNAERERAKARAYYARNREKVIARVQAYQAKRRET